MARKCYQKTSSRVFIAIFFQFQLPDIILRQKFATASTSYKVKESESTDFDDHVMSHFSIQTTTCLPHTVKTSHFNFDADRCTVKL